MLSLPNEIIIHIISYADCYVKLVLSNDVLDEVQLFREGGPGLLLDKVLERGADRVLLTKMKERYFTRGSRIPIYKAIAITKDPNVLSLVCTIWGSNVSDIGLDLSYQLRLCWGIEMVDTPYNKEKYLNALHVFRDEIDKVDSDIGLSKLYNIDDITRCYRDKRVRNLLDKRDIIAYHIHVGNDDIIKKMNVDVRDVFDIVHRHTSTLHNSSFLMQYENIRLFNMRNKDSIYEDVTGVPLAAKFGLWDETPAPDFFKAIAEKDHVIVNKFMTSRPQIVNELRYSRMIPRITGFEGMDEHGEIVYQKGMEPNLYYYRKNIGGNDDLTDGRWLINYLLDHPDIEIHESTFGDLRLDHRVSGPILDYVDESNPGDIPYSASYPYTNLQIALRWYYRSNMFIASNDLKFRDRIDF